MDGYTGKILHVDLTSGIIEVEQPAETFYRTYLGGSLMGVYYLFKHTPPGADPLGPENTLSLIVGPVTGSAISGQSRVSATAKSPLNGLIAESTGGGHYFPAWMDDDGAHAHPRRDVDVVQQAGDVVLPFLRVELCDVGAE